MANRRAREAAAQRRRWQWQRVQKRCGGSEARSEQRARREAYVRASVSEDPRCAQMSAAAARAKRRARRRECDEAR